MTIPEPATETGTLTLRLPEMLRKRLARWAAGIYPGEACGILLGRAERQVTEIVDAAPARNLERARNRYLLDPDAFLAADKAARENGLEIVGIWHSHPDCPALPSPTDLGAAWHGYSYLINSITATGATEWRSWRLDGDRFVEEIVVKEEPES